MKNTLKRIFNHFFPLRDPPIIERKETNEVEFFYPISDPNTAKEVLDKSENVEDFLNKLNNP